MRRRNASFNKNRGLVILFTQVKLSLKSGFSWWLAADDWDVALERGKELRGERWRNEMVPGSSPSPTQGEVEFLHRADITVVLPGPSRC